MVECVPVVGRELECVFIVIKSLARPSEIHSRDRSHAATNGLEFNSKPLSLTSYSADSEQ